MVRDNIVKNDEAACGGYIDDFWFLLHHSESDDNLVLGLTFYLDDSGSDEGSQLVTCGGLVMSRLQFKEFYKRWARMYKHNQFRGYSLEQPLHMSDFVGRGKYAGLYPEFKRALFLDAVKLINGHKLYSVSVAVSQVDFKNELGEDVRKNLIGAYAFAFFLLALTHQDVSKGLATGPLKTAYLVDRGFGYQDQLNQAHAIIVGFEKAFGGFRHTGALATDSDDDIPALQAADAIAWASRQMELHGELPEGFEPLSEVLREDSFPPHTTISLPRDAVQMLADPINEWISKHGTVPRLTDIMARKIPGFVVKLKP